MRPIFILLFNLSAMFISAQKTTNTSVDSLHSPSRSFSGISFFTPKSEFSLFSTQIELGGAPTDADISFINLYGSLSLLVDINRQAYIGPYFKHTLFSTSDYQIQKYDSLDLDIATFRDWVGGVQAGTYIRLSRQFLISPELKIGYGQYTIQDVNYSESNPRQIKRSVLHFNPRFNFSMKMSEYSVFGFNMSYNLGYTFGNYKETGLYSPTGIQYGIFARFYLPRE